MTVAATVTSTKVAWNTAPDANPAASTAHPASNAPRGPKVRLIRDDSDAVAIIAIAPGTWVAQATSTDPPSPYPVEAGSLTTANETMNWKNTANPRTTAVRWVMPTAPCEEVAMSTSG